MLGCRRPRGDLGAELLFCVGGGFVDGGVGLGLGEDVLRFPYEVFARGFEEDAEVADEGGCAGYVAADGEDGDDERFEEIEDGVEEGAFFGGEAFDDGVDEV